MFGKKTVKFLETSKGFKGDQIAGRKETIIGSANKLSETELYSFRFNHTDIPTIRIQNGARRFWVRFGVRFGGFEELPFQNQTNLIGTSSTIIQYDIRR